MDPNPSVPFVNESTEAQARRARYSTMSAIRTVSCRPKGALLTFRVLGPRRGLHAGRTWPARWQEATCDEPIDQWREPPHDACCCHVPSLLPLSALYVERELTPSP